MIFAKISCQRCRKVIKKSSNVIKKSSKVINGEMIFANWKCHARGAASIVSFVGRD